MNITHNNNYCYIGLTQWQHSDWQDGPLLRSSSVHPLHAYARYFSSVEGNTTFYGLPKPETVQLWNRETPENFRFCFKFPQEITHRNQLLNCQNSTVEFLERLTPIHSKLGQLCIQLPASFSSHELSILQQFLNILPDDFSYGVEVRHLDFFNKEDEEKAFNQLLQVHNINRITFDTRALFAHPADDAVSLKAKEHKPNVPVHAIATGSQPMIRFITPMDWQWGTTYLNPWLEKAVAWLNEGKSPYFFFHTPDNAEAPELARWFVGQLNEKTPGKTMFEEWQDVKSEQTALF
ncbi:MAG: DUF72 domain-containing protein [Neptuniibacter sp.]